MDALAEHYAAAIAALPASADGSDQHRNDQLLLWRATHRAFGGLGEPDRSIVLLHHYLGRPVEDCVALLGRPAPDFDAIVRTIPERARSAATTEVRIRYEIMRSSEVWKSHFGPIPEDLIPLMRDAIRVRLRLFPSTSNLVVLRAYYLSFGHLYREERVSVCEIITDPNTGTAAAREAAKLLGLDQSASAQLKWLNRSARARRALRRSVEFVTGPWTQRPTASVLADDDLYALVHDAKLSASEVAELTGESAEVVTDRVGRYEKAVSDWVAAHPPSAGRG